MKKIRNIGKGGKKRGRKHYIITDGCCVCVYMRVEKKEEKVETPFFSDQNYAGNKKKRGELKGCLDSGGVTKEVRFMLTKQLHDERNARQEPTTYTGSVGNYIISVDQFPGLGIG